MRTPLFFASHTSMCLLQSAMAKTQFNENEETLLGYVTLYSGTLRIGDAQLPVATDTIIPLEDIPTEAEVHIPVVAVAQNGRRYVLLAIDSYDVRVPAIDEMVEVQDSGDADATS